MSNPVVEDADTPADRRRRAPKDRRRGADGGPLTLGEFFYRLGWLLVIVLSVAAAANGLALLAGV